MKKADAFTQGYLCALSCIYHGHGGSTIIDEALRASAAKEIDPKSVDEFDREMLVRFQKKGCT